MRLNLPVTGREFDYPDSEMLVSMTDKQGVITHCNAAFVKVSGYTYDELIGQPHNLIRHPDMPADAFKDMWSTIGRGRPWTAMVKNRRKDGDHYWVQAHVTPLKDHGKLVGYMSVRTKPTREQINSADALYKKMADELAKGKQTFKIHAGRIRYFGWRDLLGKTGRLHLTSRFGIASAVLLPLLFLPEYIGLSESVQRIAQGAIAVTLWALFVYCIRVMVSRPLEDAIQTAHSMASGDLTFAQDSDRTDQVGVLIRALKQATMNTRAFVYDVRTEADGIQQAITHISSGNANLASRTESQVQSLVQTTHALSLLTGNVKQTADTAQQVAQVSAETTQAAQQGGQVVQQVIQAMQGIQSSSQHMSDITQLIESIAFQTNILALNAAVEAARAGEQGRGFAVVAGEVRSLAQRSSSAAKEIRELISKSVDQVSSGTRQVEEAGATINRVVDAVTHVTDLIQGITAATAEQSGDIAQVNTSITQIDGVTQQNAALVEEASTATSSLKNQADTLVRAASVFRVK
ncbi:methyl-accepting chemotaxis protein [Aquabacterium sp.]|uniref:methyl-accepting chemotaxis protein n=1 Tax=Aquabacterium sp. TaxID=1872578 RepID=UPI0035B14529